MPRADRDFRRLLVKGGCLPVLCVGLAGCSSSAQSASPLTDASASDASAGDASNPIDAGPTDATSESDGAGATDAVASSDANGWRLSYSAPSTDSQGRLMEGTELRALVPFHGSLYAGIGYWEDTDGYASATPDPNLPGAQILRLDSPDAGWQVELGLPDFDDAGQFDTYAFAALEAVSLTTDSNGVQIPRVDVLAGTTWKKSTPGMTVYTRMATNPTWSASTVGAALGKQSGRAFVSHLDAVTGVSSMYFGSDYGIYRGTYDTAKAAVVWPDVMEAWGTAQDGGSDAPPIGAGWRVMAFADCGGKLYASVGPSIYQRHDGPSPTWNTVFTEEAQVDASAQALSGTGGLRGLYCFQNGGNPVLMTAVETVGGATKPAVLLIDPSHGFQATVDEDVLPLLHQKLGPFIRGCLLAYNHFTPVTDPATNETALLIGFESSVDTTTAPPGTPIFHAVNGDFLATPHYMVRYADGGYDVLGVGDPGAATEPPRVSVRTIAVSPFASDDAGVVYAGGFDCNAQPVHDTAWAMQAPVATALGRP
jgi:hypothetical protein